MELCSKMRTRTGQKSLLISPRWIPRIGVNPAQPLNLTMDPAWAGVANVAGTTIFKALYPRPSKWRVTFNNDFLGFSVDIDMTLILSYKQDGTPQIGYHEDGYAFFWALDTYPAAKSVFIPALGNNHNLYAIIGTRYRSNVAPNWGPAPDGTKLTFPIANPPFNDGYIMYLQWDTQAGTGGWITRNFWLGNVSGDNQSPFIAPPFSPNPDGQWRVVNAEHVTLTNSLAVPVDTGVWYSSRITVTDWEAID